jgi:hypothetical protein
VRDDRPEDVCFGNATGTVEGSAAGGEVIEGVGVVKGAFATGIRDFTGAGLVVRTTGLGEYE